MNFPSETHKSRNMIVEPYNFTLSYNSLVRSSNMIATFSNQQTDNILQQQLKVNDIDSKAYFNRVNNHISQVFSSIFNEPAMGAQTPYTVHDICQNICPCPGLNECIISQKQINNKIYQEEVQKQKSGIDQMMCNYLEKNSKKYRQTEKQCK